VSEPRLALVTGGNRGMGLETCRQLARLGLRVVLGARDESAGRRAAAELAVEGEVEPLRLDVADRESIAAAVAAIESRHSRLDVLVNNAAIYLDEGVSVLDVDMETVRRTMETNLYGPLLLCQAAMRGMIRRRYGRIVNVSSGAGQLSSMRDYAPSYSLSKAALNALTRMVADAARNAGARNVLVNAVDPGWVRTEMGGADASRSVEDGVDTTVWLATLPNGGPTGGFFHDRKRAAW
jgi:NAD(P)-dependent dehydrogenase (short-subunit alcohol dehydrogenase family)